MVRNSSSVPVQATARRGRILSPSYSRRIFNLAYRFTSNVDAAEDLTQDVFIRIYRTLDQYDPKQGDLSNWLMRLARNLIIDDYRHRQRNPQNTMADAVDDHTYHLRAAGTSAHQRDGAKRTGKPGAGRY